ncbi:MAG: sulfurtransferase-like selenium metabolism protein YedF [Clostridiaceae bacterium]
MNILDCSGLKCPIPVVNTKKYFDSIDEGEATVIIDNEVAKNNVSKLCDSLGLYYEVEEKQHKYYINVKKEKCQVCENISFEQDYGIVIGSNKMGQGEDKLGEILMKSYLFALSEQDKIPKFLIFLNSGVKLTTEGSGVIESLKALEEKDTEILSCGTCLDFYNIKDKLLIGDISNMYTIVEKMNSVKNTIKI